MRATVKIGRSDASIGFPEVLCCVPELMGPSKGFISNQQSFTVVLETAELI